MKPEHFIYKTSLLDKQLQDLLAADKKGFAAAKQAEKLIADIARDGLSDLEVASKRTNHGEQRIKKCLKYDLGSGYRLISLKKGNEVYFVFAGTHDACDRWLESKRGKAVNLDTDKVVLVEKSGLNVPVETCSYDIQDCFDEYEEQLFAELDEKTLRYVFRGICGG